jgi:copper oxidase (laccase) domain-containing protein
MLTHVPWLAVAGLRHGFLDGEESAGASWDAVVAGAGVPLPVRVPRQVHGTRVVEAATRADRPEADALSVTAPGLVGILTADSCRSCWSTRADTSPPRCTRAEWRGRGILEARSRTPHAPGPRPTSRPPSVPPSAGCYEVGPEVRAAFAARSGEVTAPAWSRPGPREHVDLRTAVRCLLQAAGVARVAVLGPCTACGASYQSYRRDGARVGRQLSFVGWA